MLLVNESKFKLKLVFDLILFTVLFIGFAIKVVLYSPILVIGMVHQFMKEQDHRGDNVIMSYSDIPKELRYIWLKRKKS